MEIRFLVKYDLRKENERYFGLLQVEAVNGDDPESAKERAFPALTPLYPDRQMKLETEPKKLPTRIMDLIAPVDLDNVV